jgi:ankyrin repeat protein
MPPKRKASKSPAPSAKRAVKKGSGDRERLNALLSFTNSKKETLLHVAVGSADVEFVGALILAGVNINAKNDKGQTPLHRAPYILLGETSIQPASNMKEEFKKRYEIIDLLLTAGADATIKDKDGKTPYADAVAKKKSEVIVIYNRHGITE